MSSKGQLRYRRTYWGKHRKILVSFQDWQDIKAAKRVAGRTAMKTATTTTDQTKVPWYIDKEPQHKPWYSGKKNKDNEYICQLIN